MKIYERDGKKYVETDTVSNCGYCNGVQEVYLSPTHAVCVKDRGDAWLMSGLRILRPATPEEIAAGEDKKMCPAGCGSQYANHFSHDCPWKQAFHAAKGSIESGYLFADAHWSEFVKKDDKEKPVRCTCGSDQMAVKNWSHRLDCAYYKAEIFKQARMVCGVDLANPNDNAYIGYISEEKQARAATAAKSSGAKVGDEGLSRSSAPSPQTAPPAMDDAAFYKHVWGFPKPFEINAPIPNKEEYRQCPICDICSVHGNNHNLPQHAYELLQEVRDTIEDLGMRTAFELEFLYKKCPECGGTGRQNT